MKPISYSQLFSKRINSRSKPRKSCFSRAYARSVVRSVVRLVVNGLKVRSALSLATLLALGPGLRLFYHRCSVILSKSAVLLVRLYQKTLSPLFPPCCRHYPSCSNYAVKVFEKKGFFKGSLLTLKRVLSCNPFVKPRWDERF